MTNLSKHEEEDIFVPQSIAKRGVHLKLVNGELYAKLYKIWETSTNQNQDSL